MFIGFLPFAGSKSGGVRVSRRTFAHIRQGDAARSDRQWQKAANAYGAALAREPGLFHIWIQHGHMLKQVGRSSEADDAYRAAGRLRPDAAEPWLNRAHLASRRGEYRDAIQLFMAAYARNGHQAETVEGLRHVLDADGPLSPSALEAVSQAIRNDADDPSSALMAGRPSEAGTNNHRLVFDVTDLIGHVRGQRVPTGIQRVQLEIVTVALARSDQWVGLCCFVRATGRCVELPTALFQEMASLISVSSETEDHDWQAFRTTLLFKLVVGREVRLPTGATLVNLGTSLWVADYFRFIRTAKERAGIRYLPFVHDLIPVVMPNVCTRAIVTEFNDWIAGVFDHADGFICNSRSTAADLEQVASRLGGRSTARKTAIVPLDARTSTPDPASPERLVHWGLAEQPFVLLVSTIEPRKNHVLAFSAWAELLGRHGPVVVPRLVCVGRDGWMNEAVFDRLASEPALLAHVTIIHQVTDAELSLLYRASLFTIYPSLYEGWGLPVSEALSHGRLAIVADNSALLEAGQGLAQTFKSGRPEALIEAAERAIFDEKWRLMMEANIAGHFFRDWNAVGEQLVSAAKSLTEDLPSPVTAHAPVARAGAYYSLRLHRPMTLDLEVPRGEAFRIGEGWAWPEDDGCRLLPREAELRMRLKKPVPDGAALHLRVQGLGELDCPVRVTIGGQETSTVVAPRSIQWLRCPIPTSLDETLAVIIKGEMCEDGLVKINGIDRDQQVCVKVSGFLIAAHEEQALLAMANIDRWYV